MNRAAWFLERPLIGKTDSAETDEACSNNLIEQIPNWYSVEFTYLKNYAEYFFKEL